MKIKLGSNSIDLSEAGHFLQTASFDLTPNQLEALYVIEKWESGAKSFFLTTSGSTGPVKEIRLPKELLIWSANNTRNFLNLGKDEKVLCCLPLNKAGGFMMLVRSLIFGWDIDITEPGANPLVDLKSECSFVSLLPYQFYQIMNDEKSIHLLKNIRTVLIGGAELRADVIDELQHWHNSVYHSYGMTETASHIALKTLNGKRKTSFYQLLSGVSVWTDEETLLHISIPQFDITLKTKDKAVLHSEGLEIIGREEFFINSGGLKLNAVEMEDFISEWLNANDSFREVCVVGQTDHLLGEKIVLFVAGKPFSDDIEKKLETALEKNFGKYLLPKEIRYLEKIPLVNFKVDRKALRKIF